MSGVSSDRVRSLLELAERYRDAKPGHVSAGERALAERIIPVAQEWEAMRAALERIAEMPERFTTPGASEYLGGQPTRIRDAEDRLNALGVRLAGGYAQAIDVAVEIARAALSAGVSPQPKEES